MLKSLINKARKLGRWQKSIVTKQKLDEEEIPHPAAAPISTDQEAAGRSTTPDGQILDKDHHHQKRVKEKDHD